MSLAQPASDESAFKDERMLRRGGRRLLVSAGIIALAFLFTIVLVSYGPGREQSLMLVIGDYVVTLGIAVPGLTLYILRLYTERSIRKGNAKVFTKSAKLGLVSASWIVLVIVVIMLVTQPPV